jgi:hypothetical protein
MGGRGVGLSSAAGCRCGGWGPPGLGLGHNRYRTMNRERACWRT